MKRCPTCNRTYTDTTLNFCLDDGTPLVSGATPELDPNATIRYVEPPDTNPPETEIYRQQAPLLNQVDASARPRQWTPVPPASPRKKSSAIWWILGGVIVLALLVVGVAVLILVLASMGSNTNENANRNANTRNSNTRVVNRNANANTSNSNSNLASEFTDDFSEKKWGTGKFTYGDISYENDEYRMRSKEETYLVMYAPNNDYNTEDATVRVTVRSVDGTPASSGFGLITHGEKSQNGALEDYGLLIYTGSEPQYEIIQHKAGNQSIVVSWTKSSVIRTGSSPNQLEIRAQGLELTFYINGQYVDRIKDTENFRRGVAGLYTSGTTQVAFDDLEIER